MSEQAPENEAAFELAVTADAEVIPGEPNDEKETGA